MAKKLKGHKPGCKCSADTRKRGMKAMGLAKSRPNPHKHNKHNKHKNPLTRKEAASEAKYSRYLYRAAGVTPKSMPTRAAYYYGRAQGVASVIEKRSNSKQGKRVGAGLVSRAGTKGINLGLGNPKKRRSAIEKFYRNRKASVKKAMRKFVPRKKNLPTPHFIGSNVSAPRHHFGRNSRLYTGPGLFSVTISGARGGAPRGSVSRLDYDNPSKAQRAYGKKGRFFHIFKKSVRAVSIGNGKIKFMSSSPLWRASL